MVSKASKVKDKKVVLITGASRGIGKAIALALGSAGDARNNIIIGTATSDHGAAAITAYLQEHQLQGQGMKLNVADLESINAVIAAIVEQYGSPDILVNNAAVTRDNLFLRMKEDEWSDVINTNLTSVFRVTKACIRPMVKARWGRVINIGSVVGTCGNPGQTNYSAAKAAVLGFTKSLALELASRNITVNTVAPGFVDTDMTRALNDAQREALVQMVPVGRVAQPEEIADVVAFLASDKAAYITGQTLHVNGGMLME